MGSGNYGGRECSGGGWCRGGVVAKEETFLEAGEEVDDDVEAELEGGFGGFGGPVAEEDFAHLPEVPWGDEAFVGAVVDVDDAAAGDGVGDEGGAHEVGVVIHGVEDGDFVVDFDGFEGVACELHARGDAVGHGVEAFGEEGMGVGDLDEWFVGIGDDAFHFSAEGDVEW